MPLYDYLYVDLPKVISIYSQITGGLVESRETSQETFRSANTKRAYDFKVFSHDVAAGDSEKRNAREVVKPHHSLLVELEQELSKNGYLIDLSQDELNISLRDSKLRELLSSSLCIKVTGRAVIEDYERIKGVAGAFPEVAKLINKSIESNVKDSSAYKAAHAQLESFSADVKQTADRNSKKTKEAQLKELKAKLAAVVESASSIKVVDQWILDGLKTWIDTFLPGIINLRIYPSSQRPDEQIFGHLKRECFEDNNSSSFHFTYGSVPTEQISLIGIVTSVPGEQSDAFTPLAEFSREGLESSESVEQGFRGVFRGFDGLEQMIRTCRFPRVLVQPLIVYRSVEPRAVER